MLHPDGSLEQVSDDGRCDGRYIVQSFYTAYAEQRLGHPDATSEAVAQRCDPLTGWNDTVVPARVPDPAGVREVVACIHGAWAPTEVDDVPHYLPVTAPTVPAGDVAPLLEGLDRANATVGPLDACPWRGSNRHRADPHRRRSVVRTSCSSATRSAARSTRALAGPRAAGRGRRPTARRADQR